MAYNDQPCSIGEMRWLVSLAHRHEIQDTDGVDLDEQYRLIAYVHAKIMPKVEMAMFEGENIETPITHEVTFRWQPYEDVGLFDTIIRYVNLPNDERRVELFRIRRIEEWEGRHRYIIADCELEAFKA
jgi:hypothetical protein